MEALGGAGGEYKPCPQYAAFVAQLTAAKLNLAATANIFEASCADWTDPVSGKSILGVIADCETSSKCGCASKSAGFSLEACIASLDAFNQSPDVLVDGVTPAPFDRPSVDDSGRISGADPKNYTAAHTDGKVFGRGSC
jgi:hypothetical protein